MYVSKTEKRVSWERVSWSKPTAVTYIIPLRIKFSSYCDLPSWVTFLYISAIENWAQEGLGVLHSCQQLLLQEEEGLPELGLEAVLKKVLQCAQILLHQEDVNLNKNGFWDSA